MNINALTASTSTALTASTALSAASSTASAAAAATATSTQAAADTNAVARAMVKVDARIQDRLDAAGTQLSALGKLKAAVSDAQLAAHALAGLASTSTTADITAAAGRFVATFNAAITAAKQITQGSAEGTAQNNAQNNAMSNGASADAGDAGRLGRDLSRSVVANTATLDALRKFGIKPASDGSLTLDTAKFAAASQADAGSVRSALSGVGQSVAKTASAELATQGHLGASIASLSQRFSTLTTHQRALQQMEQTFAPASSAASSSAGNVSTALAAYLKNN